MTNKNIQARGPVSPVGSDRDAPPRSVTVKGCTAGGGTGRLRQDSHSHVKTILKTGSLCSGDKNRSRSLKTFVSLNISNDSNVLKRTKSKRSTPLSNTDLKTQLCRFHARYSVQTLKMASVCKPWRHLGHLFKFFK